ncbi:MAG: DsbE family thiol:disulfide interchange protein [Hahellaceae bacterium]|nr:DsbE family thiol:disulfide interchange protein [Hahellaceae bacterium]
MKRLLLIVPLVLVVLLLVVLGSGLGNDPTHLESARIGKAFPAFKLTALEDGNREITESDLKGDVFLVNVWATWCPSCKAEHPYLLDIAREQAVTLIGMNYKDDSTAAMGWLKRLGNPYRFTISDPQGTLGFDLGVYGAPETYVVDANGVVRYRHVGAVDTRVWNETLKPLIIELKRRS